MIRAFKSGLCLLAAAVCMLPVAGRANSTLTDPFAGVVWIVKCTPNQDAMEAGRTEFSCAMFFDGGKLNIEELAKVGFTPMAYTLSGTNSTYFANASDSGENGTIQINGQLTGGSIVGTMLWTRPSGNVYTYTMSAELEQLEDANGSGGE